MADDNKRVSLWHRFLLYEMNSRRWDNAARVFMGSFTMGMMASVVAVKYEKLGLVFAGLSALALYGCLRRRDLRAKAERRRKELFPYDKRL
jgi:UDP-N-acetylmuramyl pentapeptide phosphotransferase/UDP-N-acetylglucosamine-1-phosphate transferase